MSRVTDRNGAYTCDFSSGDGFLHRLIKATSTQPAVAIDNSVGWSVAPGLDIGFDIDRTLFDTFDIKGTEMRYTVGRNAAEVGIDQQTCSNGRVFRRHARFFENFGLKCHQFLRIDGCVFYGHIMPLC